ncbi:MAG: sodium-dependent transporter [Clostridia bacterium]|nr:sodium-dependent transporter [Clostridia bacterium]
MEKKRTSFGGSLGFVLAAAGSAVGLGNIWRFPYLAARDGGGLFIVIYIILALTFGYTLLTSEIAIGRKTKQSPLTAYSHLGKKGWKFLGVLSCIVPMLILPYYSAIGGWLLKYFGVFVTGKGFTAASDEYFTGFISGTWQPIIFHVIFFAVTAVVVIRGVNKGIESLSKILMPVLLIMIVGISIFSLTIIHTDADGTVRTGLQGLKILFVPSFEGLTLKQFFTTVMDAMGQLFFSISVAMGIMVAYGSYVSDKDNLDKSVRRIELFDTGVALLAGIMIIPAVYAFMGKEGLEASGPSLMFVSLPKVFAQMGVAGNVVGAIFFAMVIFAALTSSVSILEAIVSSFMDAFGWSRKKAVIIEGLIALVGGIIVCLGYNKLLFEVTLPNGSTGQILDILDYISNSALMPIVAISTCILVGWFTGPKMVIDEVQKTGAKMTRKHMFYVVVKFLAPVLMFVLFLKSIGVLTII